MQSPAISRSKSDATKCHLRTSRAKFSRLISVLVSRVKSKRTLTSGVHASPASSSRPCISALPNGCQIRPMRHVSTRLNGASMSSTRPKASSTTAVPELGIARASQDSHASTGLEYCGS
eukprot:2187789-Rhodomonas_salina.2